MNNNDKNTNNNNSISSNNLYRMAGIRRRLELNRRNENNQENNNQTNNLTQEKNNSIQNKNESQNTNEINKNDQNNISNQTQTTNNNENNIIQNEHIYHHQRIQRINIDEQNVINTQNQNNNIIRDEEQKKPDKELNIDNEIKDTVKCYICLDKISKPKMCPRCHRMACEKCLYNWFIKLRKNKCGFCRESVKYKEMISVPFMDTVIDLIEQFYDNKKYNEKNTDLNFKEYCSQHTDEILYYYCLDCGKAYCKTCFVFFGEEKDKHIGHSIIEYEKYKNMSLPLIRKNAEKLDNNIRHVEENIQRCLSYKAAYEFEKKIGNEVLKTLQDGYNKQMDLIIKSIDDQIIRLKEYINEYDKYKKEIESFYDSFKNKKNNNNDKSAEGLIIKLTKINQKKFFSGKEIEKFIDLSKTINVKTYISKIGEFNHDNIFLSKGLKLGNSQYEIVIDNSQRDEVQINLIIPKEKTDITHSFQAFILIKKKGDNAKTYSLDDYREDDNFGYLKKKIPWDYYGESLFKIRGMLYEYYLD